MTQNHPLHSLRESVCFYNVHYKYIPMSGALVELVSKGAQDVYLTTSEGMSFFNLKYQRHTNFSQAPKLIKEISTEDVSIIVPVWGDLLNAMWFEGTNLLNSFFGAKFSLYIGGQKVDSYDFDYSSDIWQNYMADTYTKSQEINNKCSTTNPNFLSLHYFFGDNNSFIPLVALQFHQVEIKIDFAPGASAQNIRCYGNYIYLDAEERRRFTSKKMDIIITQCQQIKKTLDCDDTEFYEERATEAENEYNEANTLLQALQTATPPNPTAINAQQLVVDQKLDAYNSAQSASTSYVTSTNGYNDIDLSQFNHPVKSLFFGYTTKQAIVEKDYLTFKTAEIQINGTPLLENMSPLYFHIVQNYNHTKFGIIQYDEDKDCPFYTRYFAYNFCLDASSFKPTGTCNFSRLDNAKLILRNVKKGYERAETEELTIYAVNYNILRIDKGMAGVLFAN